MYLNLASGIFFSLFKIGLVLVLFDSIEQSQIVVEELGRYTVIQIHKITDVMMVAVDMTEMIPTTCMFSAWDLL